MIREALETVGIVTLLPFEIDPRKPVYARSGWEAQQLEAGDIVTYAYEGALSHVGLVTQVERFGGEVAGVTVLRKWGKDAEILHPMSDVPVIYGMPSDFWSERTPHVIR